MSGARHSAVAMGLAAILLVGAAAGCGGSGMISPGVSRSPIAGGTGLSSTRFAEIDSKADGEALLASVHGGTVIRQLLPAMRSGRKLSGLARIGPDSLVATYNREAECTSDVNGCGPKPDTCGAEIVRLDIATGKVTTLARFGTDKQVYSATPNPAHSELAMLVAPCVPAYFNAHVDVLRLADHKTWSIGATLPRCHGLFSPTWVDHGKKLLMAYGPARKPYVPKEGADGSCPTWHHLGLIEVPSQSGQPRLDGRLHRPPPHCSYDSLAAQGAAIYAVTSCSTRYEPSPMRLHRLDASLRSVKSWYVGQCEDGDSLAIDRAGRVLLGAYLFCNPPQRGHRLKDPVSVLDELAGGKLRRVAKGGGGNLDFDGLAW
ncbi:MAG TPA: hypothetical protein VHC43_02060 [Mycobacteriales bacterium]|nr:hypothetical protein [Mycobacteriales bacterium]